MQCPKCNMNVKDDARICMHCGYKFESNQVQIDLKEEEKKIREKGSLRLWASFINLFIALPSSATIVFFLIVLSVAAQSNILYYGTLIICLLYTVFSIIFFVYYFVKAIIHVSKHSNDVPPKNKKIILCIIGVFSFIIIALIISLIHTIIG